MRFQKTKKGPCLSNTRLECSRKESERRKLEERMNKLIEADEYVSDIELIDIWNEIQATAEGEKGIDLGEKRKARLNMQKFLIDLFGDISQRDKGDHRPQ